MLTGAIRSFLADAPAPRPPGPLRRDRALVAALAVAALLEVALRDDVALPGLAALAVVAPLACLPWRRVRPLLVTTVVVATIGLGDAVAILVAGDAVEIVSASYVLLLPYALFRWGSGVEAAAGMGLVLAWPTAVGAAEGSLGEVVLGLPVLLLPAALGASMRYRAGSRLSEADRIRLREREQLARELHDTVAHHVSAIAIRAQAGRALAASRPEAAVDALEVIEEAASRTLADMRSLVGALRDGDEAELAPQGGIADLRRLGRDTHGGPAVDVRLAGDLEALPPLIGAAIYRIAQEAITNAVRHARHATRVDVSVSGDRERIRMTIRDDGHAVPSGGERLSGYGLVGMTERAALLGGTLHAGPGEGGGWTVTAELPRNGRPR